MKSLPQLGIWEGSKFGSPNSSWIASIPDKSMVVSVSDRNVSHAFSFEAKAMHLHSLAIPAKWPAKAPTVICDHWGVVISSCSAIAANSGTYLVTGSSKCTRSPSKSNSSTVRTLVMLPIL